MLKFLRCDSINKLTCQQKNVSSRAAKQQCDDRSVITGGFCVLLFVMATGSLRLSAQDLHFSQFFNSPLTTNPANTGFLPDGDYRLGINYRNQWSTIMSVPYKTMS